MVMCAFPGCVSYARSGQTGQTLCPVHEKLNAYPGARVCDVCRGYGKLGASACSRCNGVGVLDKASHAPSKGRDRRREPVDDRGLITAQSDVSRETQQ